MTEGPRITPCLWFNFNAEEAVAHYLAIFRGSRITALTRYGEGQPGPVGAVMTIAFEIEGQPFLALNGGPQFPFTPAMSLIVNCAIRTRSTNTGTGYPRAAPRAAAAG